MRKRYGTDFDEGLRIWREYSLRFIENFDENSDENSNENFDENSNENSDRLNVFIFDFNRFCREPVDTFSELLSWFGRPVDLETLRGHISSFWSAPTSTPASAENSLPSDIQKLYSDLLRRVFSVCENP
jgi:hypothetical protein